LTKLLRYDLRVYLFPPAGNDNTCWQTPCQWWCICLESCFISGGRKKQNMARSFHLSLGI